MNIKHEPPSDAEIAEAVGPSPLAAMLPVFREIQAINTWAYRGCQCIDDHRNATAPGEPIAVHGEQDD